MLMYERRIENSMIKMMKELKRFQVIRRIERQEVEKKLEPSPSQRDSLGGHSRKGRLTVLTAEAATRLGVKECDLKKQTVRQGKLVQFSRFESCPAKVSRPAGMNTCVSGGNKWYEAM
jgi:hypothetical protein